jgi:hypothetical protein
MRLVRDDIAARVTDMHARLTRRSSRGSPYALTD